MDGTFRRDGNTGEPAQQALTDFASTPAGVLVLYVQDEIFDLERKSVGVAIRTSASVRDPLHAAFLINDRRSYSRSCGRCQTPCKSHKLQSLIHYRTLLPRHHFLPSKGRKCHLCVRYNVLPMSQAAHYIHLETATSSSVPALPS